MPKLIAVLIAVLAYGCKGPDYSVNAYYGVRSLTTDFDNIDEHGAFGADVVLALKNEFLAVEGGFLRSQEEDGGGVVTEVDLNEYFVGLRLIPWKILLEPYASVGVSFVDGSFTSATSEDDLVAAGYVRVGAAYPLTSVLRVGLDGRALLGSDFDTNTVEENADYFQLMVFLGVGL